MLDPNPYVAGTYPLPDIVGDWLGRDGTTYRFEQSADGTLTIDSDGRARGHGVFIDNMPNKFTLQLADGSEGEFAVTTDGQRMMGWFMHKGQKTYETLTRQN